jgi:hypothetical protein
MDLKAEQLAVLAQNVVDLQEELRGIGARQRRQPCAAVRLPCSVTPATGPPLQPQPAAWRAARASRVA